MKKNSPPIQPSTATVDDLVTQRQALVQAQTDAHARLESAGVLDWRTVSTANSDLAAIGAAIAAIDLRIDAARADLAQAGAKDREALQDAQRHVAVKAARTATRASIAVLQHLDVGAMAELDRAVAGVAAVSGHLPPETAVVLDLRRAVSQCLRKLEFIDPALVGKPPRATAKETAIGEAREALARATAHLSALQVARTWDSASSQKTRRLEDAAEAVATCQQRLTNLTGETFRIQNARQAVANFARYTNPVETESAELTL